MEEKTLGDWVDRFNKLEIEDDFIIFYKDFWKVVEYKHQQLRGRVETQDIYSSIELFDAKLHFMDGVSPEEYNFKIIK